jgi:hypothetical protein
MLAYIPVEVTQGVADAYASQAFITGLQGISNLSFRLRELLIEIPLQNSSAANFLQVQITRRSKAAIALITDPDVLFAMKLRRPFDTAVGFGPLENVVLRHLFSEDEDVRIVEDQLYLNVDSDATAAASTIYARLGVESVRITETERLNLLVRSLD